MGQPNTTLIDSVIYEDGEIEGISFNVTTSGEAGPIMRKLLACLSECTQEGAGTTITVDSGMGTEEFYLDGDGYDQVIFEYEGWEGFRN